MPRYAVSIDDAMAEGETKGKAETTREIALNMLREGATEAFVCRATKLTRKEVQLLKRGIR